MSEQLLIIDALAAPQANLDCFADALSQFSSIVVLGAENALSHELRQALKNHPQVQRLAADQGAELAGLISSHSQIKTLQA